MQPEVLLAKTQQEIGFSQTEIIPIGMLRLNKFYDRTQQKEVVTINGEIHVDWVWS
jgi:hypothetical protein